MTVRQFKEEFWLYLKKLAQSESDIKERWDGLVVESAKDPNFVDHNKSYQADFSIKKYKKLDELLADLTVFINGTDSNIETTVFMRISSHFTRPALDMPLEEVIDMDRLLRRSSLKMLSKIFTPELKEKYLKEEVHTEIVWSVRRDDQNHKQTKQIKQERG